MTVFLASALDFGVAFSPVEKAAVQSLTVSAGQARGGGGSPPLCALIVNCTISEYWGHCPQGQQKGGPLPVPGRPWGGVSSLSGRYALEIIHWPVWETKLECHFVTALGTSYSLQSVGLGGSEISIISDRMHRGLDRPPESCPVGKVMGGAPPWTTYPHVPKLATVGCPGDSRSSHCPLVQ